MNEKQLEFSLKSLEADAAIEALERRERGEPASAESPLSESEVAAIKALAVDLDEEFIERKAAQLISALSQPEARELGSLDDARAARAARNAGVARDAGAARASRSRRLKQVALALGPLALAAGFLLWLMPIGQLDAVLETAQVEDTKLRRAHEPGTEPAALGATALQLTPDGCLNVRIPLRKSAAHLSEDVATQAYLVSGQRSVRWNLLLQPDPTGALSTTGGCQRLPAEVASGAWELVVLVGYPGRLWWHGNAALRATMGGGERGAYSGIQYVRRSLQLGQLGAGPAELPK